MVIFNAPEMPPSKRPPQFEQWDRSPSRSSFSDLLDSVEDRLKHEEEEKSLENQVWDIPSNAGVENNRAVMYASNLAQESSMYKGSSGSGELYAMQSAIRAEEEQQRGLQLSGPGNEYLR